jgi:hypothetical protein
MIGSAVLTGKSALKIDLRTLFQAS